MIRFAFISLIAMLLCSCGGYLTRQSPESMNSPVDCDGYHVKTATWHFMDNQGEQYNIMGRCVKGQKHGNFDFFVNGQLIARTKYTRDMEVKTKCYIKGVSAGNLDHCLSMRTLAKQQSNTAAKPIMIYQAPANQVQATPAPAAPAMPAGGMM